MSHHVMTSRQRCLITRNENVMEHHHMHVTHCIDDSSKILTEQNPWLSAVPKKPHCPLHNCVIFSCDVGIFGSPLFVFESISDIRVGSEIKLKVRSHRHYLGMIFISSEKKPHSMILVKRIESGKDLKWGYGNLGWITGIEAYFEQTRCFYWAYDDF